MRVCALVLPQCKVVLNFKLQRLKYDLDICDFTEIFMFYEMLL